MWMDPSHITILYTQTRASLAACHCLAAKKQMENARVNAQSKSNPPTNRVRLLSPGTPFPPALVCTPFVPSVDDALVVQVSLTAAPWVVLLLL